MAALPNENGAGGGAAVDAIDVAPPKVDVFRAGNELKKAMNLNTIFFKFKTLNKHDWFVGFCFICRCRGARGGGGTKEGPEISIG